MLKKFLCSIFVIFISVCLMFFIKIHKQTDLSIIKIEFTSWGSESELNILKPIITDFEKENPNIKIEFLHIPQNYYQKLHLLFASNTAPDVVFINNQYLPIYANANMLESLDDLKQDFELNKFYKQSIDSLTYKNNLYAIPRDISNLVIFYNKDLFDKYKVKYAKDDWTYEEFLNTAQKLTHKNEVFGISFEEEPLFYLPYLMSFGLEGIPYFEDKTTQYGLNIYSDLRNKYKVAPKKSDIGSLTMAQMFLQEKLAMHLSGRWLVPKYRENASFDWDIVRFPAGSAGSIVPTDSSGWAITKTSKHKQEALKFIKYLSSKKVSEQFTQGGLIVPARIDVANSKYFMDDLLPRNNKAFLETIKNSKATPVSIDYREKIDNLKTKTEYLFNKE